MMMESKKQYADVDAFKKKFDIFAKFGVSTAKTDALVENLLFRRIEVKPEDASQGSETTALSESLTFSNLEKNRNLVFDDENSLALKSL
jgi:hypothetical protein